ncbi:hypothetical protein B0H10DRAFT_2222992 [Mycena sp. CBHHK59/15]|nr:hypothetical protein B0H10DRAFT_2240223 [Mycena sp. CBHHK59/15]KAJ6596773.1 hypothetical protein B0H10DRAFT_2232228 [Mycena sp. CBHHK59/15]KAJ6612637.1 hypothetical protein B0H10DRAFT_2222992 [Mycena sp. CBHHK59/15]
MHEVIALKTFQTAAIAEAISSYLFHYLKEQLQKELKTPGKVAEGAENRGIYRRRTALTNNHYDSVRKQGFRRLVGRLVAEEACNSDDEPVKLDNGNDGDNGYDGNGDDDYDGDSDGDYNTMVMATAVQVVPKLKEWRDAMMTTTMKDDTAQGGG